MHSKISGIEIDEICGGQVLFGKKVPVKQYKDKKPFVELLKSEFAEILEIFDLQNTPKAIEFYKKFDAYADLEEYDKVFQEGIFIAPLVWKKYTDYIVIGIRFEADNINNGDIKVKDLKKFEEFRNLKRGSSKFVVCV